MIPAELDRILRDLDPRLVPLVFVLILVLGGVAGLQFGIKPALAYYVESSDKHAAAKQTLAAESRIELESVTALESEVARLNTELYGDSAGVPRAEIESFVVNTLARISSLHGIDLLGITPDGANKVLMFEELPYSVEVAGSYFALHRWLYQVEEELRPMVVKQFEIVPSRSDETVTLSLRIVAYRAIGEGGA